MKTKLPYYNAVERSKALGRFEHFSPESELIGHEKTLSYRWARFAIGARKVHEYWQEQRHIRDQAYINLLKNKLELDEKLKAPKTKYFTGKYNGYLDEDGIRVTHNGGGTFEYNTAKQNMIGVFPNAIGKVGMISTIVANFYPPAEYDDVAVDGQSVGLLIEAGQAGMISSWQAPAEYFAWAADGLSSVIRSLSLNLTEYNRHKTAFAGPPTGSPIVDMPPPAVILPIR